MTEGMRTERAPESWDGSLPIQQESSEVSLEAKEAKLKGDMLKLDKLFANISTDEIARNSEETNRLRGILSEFLSISIAQRAVPEDLKLSN